jgi:hypothetical protein
MPKPKPSSPFRHELAEALRDSVVWPQNQEWIVQVSEDFQSGLCGRDGFRYGHAGSEEPGSGRACSEGDACVPNHLGGAVRRDHSLRPPLRTTATDKRANWQSAFHPWRAAFSRGPTWSIEASAVHDQLRIMSAALPLADNCGLIGDF